MSLMAANMEPDKESATALFSDESSKLVRASRRSRVGQLAAFLLASGPLTSLADDNVHRERLPYDFASATVQVCRDADTLLMGSSTAYMKYKSRITQLHSFAEEDGVVVNAASQREFLEFAYSDP